MRREIASYRAQKYGPEALAIPSRRRDAPASMDVGATVVGSAMYLGWLPRVHGGASGAVWAASGRGARNASKSWYQFLRSKTDGHFQLLGAYGTFFDRQKLENR
jgi:hypothetical protein